MTDDTDGGNCKVQSGRRDRTSNAYKFMLAEVKQSWKSAVRAMNVVGNSGLNDTHSELKEVVALLSSCLEFCETMAEVRKESE
jgi:hypothetical protein